MKMDTMLERIKNMADKLSISSIKDDTAMKIMKQYVDSIDQQLQAKNFKRSELIHISR